MSLDLSIICAIRNNEATLQRMLDSIVDDGLDFDQYEILACDDCSTDSSYDILRAFLHSHEGIRMSILRTSKDIMHCPANTRQYALSEAKGKWVRFIDGDDSLTGLGSKKFIDEFGDDFSKAMVKSNVDQVTMNGEFIQHLPTNTTVLHGNFYNRQFLLDHNIIFKPDMRIFEDMYFNSSIFSNVFYFGDPNVNLGYMNEVTYNWSCDEATLSSQMYQASKGHIELYHIDDWIKGAFFPFEHYLHIWPVSNADLFKNRLCQITFALYFYYENGIFRANLDNIDSDVLDISKQNIQAYFCMLYEVCEKAFRQELVDVLHDAADVFCEEYFMVTSANNYFVPQHSLQEFVEMMS